MMMAGAERTAKPPLRQRETIGESMRRIAVAATLIPILVACTDDNVQQSAAVSEPLAEPVVALEIPGTAPNGDLNFGYAKAATRLSDGTVVIADNLGPALQYIDAKGDLIKSAGRQGGGPAEFEGISWLGQCGPDSVFVWDGREFFMSVFDAEGEFVRKYRFPANRTLATRVGSTRCSRDGVFAMQGLPWRPRIPTPEDPGEQYRTPLWLADASGNATHDIDDVSIGELRPMGKYTGIALTSDYMFVGTADSAYVDVYGLDGVLSHAIAVGMQPRRPTAHHYERAILAQVGSTGSTEFRREWIERLSAIPMPGHMPLYANVFADAAGKLWVQVSVPGDSTTQLRAFEPDGSMVRDVHLPPDLRVLEVGVDYVIVAYEDEGGEPYVVVYRM
jgi:hypothetical protein